MAETFGQRLQERIRALGPLCVGIDPSASLLASWGRPDSVEGLEFMSLAILEASIGSAAAIKPQVAYFERFAAAGYRLIASRQVHHFDGRSADFHIARANHIEAGQRIRLP